jgi:hypothetical protein
MPRVHYLWGTSPHYPLERRQGDAQYQTGYIAGKESFLSPPEFHPYLQVGRRDREFCRQFSIGAEQLRHCGSIPCKSKISVFLSTTPRPVLGAHQLPLHCIPVVLPGIRHLKCNVDHSPQSRTEVTNNRSYTSTTPRSCAGETLPLPSLYLSGSSNRVVSLLLLPT